LTKTTANVVDRKLIGVDMTNELAIEILKNESCNGCLHQCISAYDCPYECRYKDAINVAIKALEKQIPKKIAIQEESDGDYHFVCPICNVFLSLYYKNDKEKHCYNCGQRLE